MRYLHFSAASGLLNRHGGVRRSEQIEEILKNLTGTSLNPYLGLRRSIIFSIYNPTILIEALLFSIYLFFSKGLSLRGLMQYSMYSVRLMKALREHHYDVVILETAANISIPFMHYMAWRRVKFIALPHNIEYMVPHQIIRIFRSNHHVYKCELEGYRAAELVLTISDFDTAILRCGGVVAETLEYRPKASDRAFCEVIRNARIHQDSEDFFLLLGSVINTPTYVGMKNLLEKVKICNLKIRIIVVGYGTEQLNFYNSSSIAVLGPVSNEKLKSLLVNARAILINQPQTTGFLTKIVDMNACGLPQILLNDYLQVNDMERFGIIRSELDRLPEVRLPSSFDILPEISSNNTLTQFLSNR